MYNVTMTAKIQHLDGVIFSDNTQVWSNVPYDGVLFCNKLVLTD